MEILLGLKKGLFYTVVVENFRVAFLFIYFFRHESMNTKVEEGENIDNLVQVKLTNQFLCDQAFEAPVTSRTYQFFYWGQSQNGM